MAYTYEYPRPAVTADCVVITKERLRVGAKAGMAEPKVLLIERGGEPFKGCWAFPGGFMNMDETTEQCAFRFQHCLNLPSTMRRLCGMPSRNMRRS